MESEGIAVAGSVRGMPCLSSQQLTRQTQVCRHSFGKREHAYGRRVSTRFRSDAQPWLITRSSCPKKDAGDSPARARVLSGGHPAPIGSGSSANEQADLAVRASIRAGTLYPAATA